MQTLSRSNYKTKSLPRPVRQLSLSIAPNSKSVLSDSEDPSSIVAVEEDLMAKRPRGSDNKLTPSSSSEDSAGRAGQMDELAAQLDKLGSYIQRREQGTGQDWANSESEMEEHLQGIREALLKSKREEEEQQKVA